MVGRHADAKGLVVVPTYNEHTNIERLIEAITALDLHVLVVDDASPDGTGVLVEKLAERDPAVHVMRRSGKLGLGTAYVEGFGWGVRQGYELICGMDADFSHDPSYLPQLIEAAARADVVIGSRYLNGISIVNWSLYRLILSYGANVYARSVTGMPVRDCTSGFHCFRRQALEGIALETIRSNGFAFQIEIAYRSWRAGYRIREVPIIFYERQSGKSKLSKRVMLEGIWVPWRLLVHRLLGKRGFAG